MKLQSFADITPIDDWQDYKRDGDQFLKTATGAVEKCKKTFNPEAIYNLTAMAIEKFIMAFLMRHGDLAENHTMRDLVFALERHLGSQPEIADKLYFMDGFQEICEIETYVIKVPTQDDLKTFISIGKDVQEMLAPYAEELAE
ncbi:MAG: hypothetical protein OCC45_12290 [Desulfotalea sp.]